MAEKMTNSRNPQWQKSFSDIDGSMGFIKSYPDRSALR